jgi:hypothetical protein
MLFGTQGKSQQEQPSFNYGRWTVLLCTSHRITLLLSETILHMIPVVMRSKAWVYGRSLAGIVGSNSAGGIDVRLLRLLFVAR